MLKLPGMADGEDWRVDFWRGCLKVCKEDAKGAALKIAWRKDPLLALSIFVGLGAGVVAATGGAGVVAGAAMTATGVLVPVGITFIVAGSIITIFGGVTSIVSIIKASRKRQSKEQSS